MGTDYRLELEAAMNRSSLSRDVCSYHRAALAALEAGVLPPPSMSLGTTPLCLGKDRLLDEHADRLGVPYLEVRVPLPPDDGETPPEDVQAVAEGLRHVYRELGRASGRKGNLERAVILSNRAAKAWAEVSEARLRGDLLLNGRQAFAFNFIGQLVRGTEAGAKGFEKLLRERGRRDLLVGGEPRLRLLWLHTVPHFDHTLVDLISEKDGVVAFEEMARMQLDQVNPANPFPGLAKRLIEHPLWGSATRRSRLVVQLASKAHVAGVIHFNHWGCRQGLGSVPAVRNALRQAGIPFLAVDGDALAAGGAGEDTAARQLESFLEML
jgi:benzoyl-CoA reductase/2-hydroxyglutaryl-CoA dehydratase subunit BcrC/BadD/HgdB